MAQATHDQSSVIRCPFHNKRAAGVFVRPDAGEMFAAFYTCSHCMRESKVPTEGTLTREQALSLPRLK